MSLIKRNLPRLIQETLELKKAKKTETEVQTPQTAAPTPQTSKSPEVSPLVVNNNFLLTYNNVEVAETTPAKQDVKISKMYTADSSCVEESELGTLYKNGQSKATETSNKAGNLERVIQMAREDLKKIAASLKSQLKAELGSDFDVNVFNKAIDRAVETTIKTFSDNKTTKSSRTYRAGVNDSGFVFSKRLSVFANLGVYSYNVQTLADNFIKNYNSEISKQAQTLDDNYAKRHPSTPETKETSILPENLQNIESKIYSDPSVLKQIQAKTKKDITTLESYRETITAVLLKYDKEPDLEVAISMIASCIDSGVQEALVKKSSAMKEVVNKNASMLEEYLESAGEISYEAFEEFLKSKNPKISNEELMSAQSFLTSFASKYISVGSVEAAAKDLESGILLPKTARAMTRSVTSDNSGWKDKVKGFVKDIINSPTFKAAVCVAFPELGAKDKAEKMSELVKSGDYRTAIIMGLDPTYHAGEINAAVSSEPAYNIVMTGLDFVPVVGEAAGVADFAISMHGALHNYTYNYNDYAESFPFRTDDMSTKDAANWHLVYDSLASVLGVVPGISSGTVKLSLSGLADVFKNAGKHMDEIVSFLKSGKGLEILKDIAKDIITCKNVDEAKLKLYQKLVKECPNLAALVKNVLVKDETGNNENRVDTENPDELPGGGGDVPPVVDDNRIKDLNGTEMPGINFQPAAGEGADWSGSMGDKNKVSGSDNNGTGFSDSYQAGFFQDGNMVTIEPTEENEAKLRAEIEEQIKNDYGSLDNVEHRITFVYDDNGDIKGAVVEVKSKATPKTETKNKFTLQDKFADRVETPNRLYDGGGYGGTIYTNAGSPGGIHYNQGFLNNMWNTYLPANGAYGMTQQQMTNAYNGLMTTIQSGNWNSFLNYLPNNVTTWSTSSGIGGYGSGGFGISGMGSYGSTFGSSFGSSSFGGGFTGFGSMMGSGFSGFGMGNGSRGGGSSRYQQNALQMLR